jgi:TRAP-type uncharacterized transport system fused permease subunit
MEGMIRTKKNLSTKLLGWGLSITSFIIIMGSIYYLTAWIPKFFGPYTWVIFGLLLVTGYIVLLLLSLRFPDLPHGDSEKLMQLEKVVPILFSGLFFLLPIITLVWGLMIFEMSPGLAAYYACLFMAFIILTQKPLVALLRHQPFGSALKESTAKLVESLIGGAKNMVGIGLATATAGIVVGAVSLTGVGQVLAAVVENLSGGFLPAVLIMTAMLAILLGMGLPTTANYIIVSTLLAPVIHTISAAHGLNIPILAVHLFCLYFGVMADATPPVALAAFAASGISGGDPFKTGVQGFIYELRTAVLPFVFLYNQEILLLGIWNPLHFLWVFITSILACIAFASATQRYMFTKTRWWEIILLLSAMVFLFRPDIPQGKFFPPYQELPPSQVEETIGLLQPDEDLRLHLVTKFENQKIKDQVIVLPFTGITAEKRLDSIGLYLAWDDDKLMIDDILINSPVEKLGVNMDDTTEVLGIEISVPRPPKWLFSIPGLFILALVVFSQLKRKGREKLIIPNRF